MSPGLTAVPLGRFSVAPTTPRTRTGSAELGERRDRLDHRRAAGHVELHLVHLRGRLQREAAGVERDRLADQAEQRRALGDAPRRLVAQLDQRGRPAEPCATAANAPIPRARGSRPLELHAVPSISLADRPGILGQRRRGQIVAGRVRRSRARFCGLATARRRATTVAARPRRPSGAIRAARNLEALAGRRLAVGRPRWTCSDRSGSACRSVPSTSAADDLVADVMGSLQAQSVRVESRVRAPCAAAAATRAASAVELLPRAQADHDQAPALGVREGERLQRALAPRRTRAAPAARRRAAGAPRPRTRRSRLVSAPVSNDDRAASVLGRGRSCVACDRYPSARAPPR